MRGRSPRGRGRQYAVINTGMRDGSIPAWAGETGAQLGRKTGRGVDPRVGGGDVVMRVLVE